MPFLVLIRRIGLGSALNGPPWLLPDPDLSESLAQLPIILNVPKTRQERIERTDYFRALKHLFKVAEGRARIPRNVRLA